MTAPVSAQSVPAAVGPDGADRASQPHRSERGNDWTGIGALTRLRLRQDRRTLLVWALCLFALVLVSVLAIAKGMDQDGRIQLTRLVNANPALLLFGGVPIGASVGAVLITHSATITYLLAGLMGTFLGVRHTRGEEASGRSELVDATAVGRRAPLAATLLTGLVESAVAGAVVVVACLVSGLSASGSLLFGLAVLGIGQVGAVIGALAGQSLGTTRSANLVAAALLVLFWLVRGAADVLGDPSQDLLKREPALIIWTSPIGWAEMTQPFASDGQDSHWWPLLLLLGLVLLFSAIALVAEAGRELGDAEPRGRGPAHAGAALGTPLGLMWRLQATMLVTWVVAATALGLSVGAMAPQMLSLLTQNAAIERMVLATGGNAQATSGLVQMAAIYTVVLVGCAGWGPLRQLQQEAEHRGELVFGTPVGRSAWFWSAAGLGLAVGLLVVAGYGLGAGIGLASVGHAQWGLCLRLIGSLAALVPLMVGFSALVLGWLPHAISWLPLVLVIVPLLGGGILGAFGIAWLAHLSPLDWVPDVGASPVHWWPLAWVVPLGLATVVLGWVGLRRRDLG